MFSRTLISITLLLLLLPVGPASSSEATPEALVRFRGFDAGLREAVGESPWVRLLDFPTANGASLNLELQRFELTTSTTRLIQAGARGEIEMPLPDIALLRGQVENEPGSKAVVVISSRRVHALVLRPDGDGVVIQPTRWVDVGSGRVPHEVLSFEDLDRQGDHALGAAGESPWWTGEEIPRCLVPPEIVPVPSKADMEDARKRATPRVCRLALECDYEFWQRLGGWEAALADIYAVMGTISTMFEDEIDVKLALTFIRIWSIPGDPYSYVGGASTGLDEFRAYWMANHNPGQPGYVQRDLAHLRSGRGVGAYAWVGTLCDYSQGFSISGGQGYPPPGGFIHDVIFAGHELGHNFGGIHTHCFNPPVDQCATDTGCNQVLDCSTAPGTMMSYCDNCPGGRANILWEFAPENEALMLAEVASSCIPYGRNPCYVDGSNTGAEDGTLAHPYDTVEEGGFFVQPAGTVIIEAGNYLETLVLWQPMTLRAANGSAVVGQ